jgi:hypothetical protein
VWGTQVLIHEAGGGQKVHIGVSGHLQLEDTQQ